jgi:hypothetical protein
MRPTVSHDAWAWEDGGANDDDDAAAAAAAADWEGSAQSTLLFFSIVRFAEDIIAPVDIIDDGGQKIVHSYFFW